MLVPQGVYDGPPSCPAFIAAAGDRLKSAEIVRQLHAGARGKPLELILLAFFALRFALGAQLIQIDNLGHVAAVWQRHGGTGACEYRTIGQRRLVWGDVGIPVEPAFDRGDADLGDGDVHATGKAQRRGQALDGQMFNAHDGLRVFGETINAFPKTILCDVVLQVNAFLHKYFTRSHF